MIDPPPPAPDTGPRPTRARAHGADFLVITPPVCTPAEPASGAFTLAAGLTARGRDVALLDLSLAFLHDALADPTIPGPDVRASLRVLTRADRLYDPHQHRTAAGTVHARLRGFTKRWPGWRLSMMDLAPPVRAHDPRGLRTYIATHDTPFSGFWDRYLAPALERERPARVLISLAYLSQLPATIDLARWLTERGVPHTVGGSLPNSLQATGDGWVHLRDGFAHVLLGDGLALLPGETGRLVDKLAWPRVITPDSATDAARSPWLSAQPVIPLPLSTGCYWNRCTFCPDRSLAFVQVPLDAIDHLFATMPATWRETQPLVHLLDSAVPPGRLRRFLPISRAHGLRFYGFARPARTLLRDGLIEDAARSGCAMLQLGTEGGSDAILERYDKGFGPEESVEVTRAIAAAGIRTYTYLLFGLPGEHAADRAATRDVIANNADAIDFLNLSLFNLPHHSELSAHPDRYGVVLGDFPDDGALRLYRPYRTRDGDPRGDARRFIEQELRAHPAIRPLIARTPRWFRAAHLAMMHVDGRR